MVTNHRVFGEQRGTDEVHTIAFIISERREGGRELLLNGDTISMNERKVFAAIAQ